MDNLAQVPSKKCLVIDDEPDICRTIAYALDVDGWTTSSCGDFSAGQKAIAKGPFDLVLLDLRLGSKSGLDLLPALREHQPDIPVVIITAYASIPSAVDAMRRGATDYLPKPFNPAELRQAINQAMATRQHQLRNHTLKFNAVLESRVPAMQILVKKALQVAQSSSTTLLLYGETGTGKGVLAKAVHEHSPRRDKPFVVVACPTLSQETLETELFGHERGAFTGAYRDHEGRLAQAEGGTLFLDEVGGLHLNLQTKLLRVLQEREYERLGGSKTMKANVRVISSTNMDLSEAVKSGRFRGDLYYRLSAVELRIPPLRERIEDLPDLFNAMLGEARLEMGQGPKGMSSQAMNHLRTYTWPGNLREVRNLVERICVLETKKKELQLEDLVALYETQPRPKVAERPESALISMEQTELAHIRAVLSQTKTLDQAAKVLGLTAVTLWRKRKKYGL